MENQDKELTRIQKLERVSESVNGMYTPEQIGVIHQNIAKGTTLNELAYFLNVCSSIELNPFNKEVWCFKDTRNNLLIFAGRDGFLARAQKNPMFNGIRSIEVRENDDLIIDVINNRIEHTINHKKIKDRGAITCGIAVVFRKSGEPTIEIADFETYDKGYNTWKTHPAEMIKKVAETHALKKAFGISGVQSEYDFDIKGGVAIPINSQKSISLEDLEEKFKEVGEKLPSEKYLHVQKVIGMQEDYHYNKAYELLKKHEK